ncbi:MULTISPECIES: mevalonate kinase [Metallosphaera]|uniref:Mevalonate kinase n=3 Tax=Metallosphaera TaxID=41980 RepID=A4YH55_METS5|nr:MULTISPECIES: mevalonate kinase [Metallosphaera]ABP95757.1 mevalonate kinase [Metallosphaera sedula DSM 5348]AIM27741.1 mevalonate kinase [Metallosphaera sedula]AKV74598.1 mevalonate kinase [Metallosphaera sedula]AKV76836.1 mevalonate kinase [Metallosphaera sedula]AKV79087.1 mevalonate kinase [Metallosphaera sedula]
MRRVEAIVPLKLTLFGEHAVVYGEPAIAMAISETMKVTVTESDRTVISSSSLNIGNIKVDLRDMRVESEQTGKALSFALEALNYFDEKKPALISIESSVDPSVGLGTSAAVIVGVVSAYSKFLGYDMTNLEIAKVSRHIEKKVQGLGSRMDTFTTSLGGVLYFPRNSEDVERVNSSLNISGGYIRRISSTAEILRRVKAVKDKSREFDDILHLIGKLVDEARWGIEREDMETVGQLMYINHGLLMSLGVTSPAIDELVSTARNMGLPGCKMSGGGGGGSVVCLKSQKAELLLESRGFRLVNTEPNQTGVVIKEIND